MPAPSMKPSPPARHWNGLRCQQEICGDTQRHGNRQAGRNRRKRDGRVRRSTRNIAAAGGEPLVSNTPRLASRTGSGPRYRASIISRMRSGGEAVCRRTVW